MKRCPLPVIALSADALISVATAASERVSWSERFNTGSNGGQTNIPRRHGAVNTQPPRQLCLCQRKPADEFTTQEIKMAQSLFVVFAVPICGLVLCGMSTIMNNALNRLNRSPSAKLERRLKQ
jgi:hypothetical protein